MVFALLQMPWMFSELGTKSDKIKFGVGSLRESDPWRLKINLRAQPSSATHSD
jgi:hypothetical protein